MPIGKSKVLYAKPTKISVRSNAPRAMVLLKFAGNSLNGYLPDLQTRIELAIRTKKKLKKVKQDIVTPTLSSYFNRTISAVEKTLFRFILMKLKR